MTKEKRPVGRLKKNPAPETPKNPDCELATKAYVKCLIRQFYPVISVNYAPRAMIWGIVGLLFGVMTYIRELGVGTSGGIFLMAAITIVSFMLAINDLIAFGAYSADTRFNLKFVKKWEPPVCKDKNDCE